MADFCGCLSSTSFRVKDRDAWLADPEVQRIKEFAETNGFFEEEQGYWAFAWYDQYPAIVMTWLDGSGEECDLDITDVIERHIHPEDVCQIGVSGNEKLRYIGGPLWFVSSTGATCLDAETCWEEKITRNIIKERSEYFVSALNHFLAGD